MIIGLHKIHEIRGGGRPKLDITFYIGYSCEIYTKQSQKIFRNANLVTRIIIMRENWGRLRRSVRMV